MSDAARQALSLWGMEDATCTFVAGRENQVFKVSGPQGDFALRMKRPGYRDESELVAELAWMSEMARAGLSVPEPLPSLSGARLERAGDHFVDMITWLNGIPIGHTREPLTLSDAPGTFCALGREMAKLHAACDAWAPADFKRFHWDVNGLLGDTPLWGRFWENPTLDTQTRQLLGDFRLRARCDLKAMTLDYGLIHADLVRENVMLDGDTLRLIDFDDGGYGFRLFDVATALLKNRTEPNFVALKDALIEGYLSERQLDMTLLDLFLALRAATYVGWIVPRMAEDGALVRNQRFIQDAQDLCAAYLDAAEVDQGE